MGQVHGQCTKVQVFSILPSPSTSPCTRLKNIGKYKYFVKNSSTSTKYLENCSQVQSSISNTTFMFHNGEGQSDENTKAAVLCMYSLFKSTHTILAFCIKS